MAASNSIYHEGVGCYIISDSDFESLLKEKSFTPMYRLFNYFKLTNRIDADTLEGYISHNELPGAFHDALISRYTYLNDYMNRKRVFMTMDLVTFYRLDEIIPSKPLLFIFKRVENGLTAVATDEDSGASPGKTIHPLHFEDLMGKGFERLVYHYVSHIHKGAKAVWLGENGGDQGRDIWVDADSGTYCYQCANYKEMTFQKGKDDIDSLVSHSHKPDHLIMVCGGSVAPGVRKKINDQASVAGFTNFELWAASAFEVKLYQDTPDLIDRFFGNKVSGGNRSPVSEDVEEMPVLEICLEPIFALKGSDEDIAVFIEEAFYLLKKGRSEYMRVEIEGEALLVDLLNGLVSQSNTAANRKQRINLKKILDKLVELKLELTEKLAILFYMDRYPVSDDYLGLTKSLRETMLISITPDQLYEETELTNYIKGKPDYMQPDKTKGSTKVDIYSDHGGKIGCSIWLTTDELDKLTEGRVPKGHLRDMGFFALDCSYLEPETIALKAIPSMIDKLYFFKHNLKSIPLNDNSSWVHFPSYRISLG